MMGVVTVSNTARSIARPSSSVFNTLDKLDDTLSRVLAVVAELSGVCGLRSMVLDLLVAVAVELAVADGNGASQSLSSLLSPPFTLSIAWNFLSRLERRMRSPLPRRLPRDCVRADI